MIPVVRPHLPSREKLAEYIDGIYERQWVTNNGPLLQELTVRLKRHLGVEHLLLVSNGTLALHVAYRALGVAPGGGEAVTTPFSFVATASSLQWEGLTPVFADIDPDTLCLDPDKARGAVTAHTRCIVPVHVYGNACDVDGLQRVAEEAGVPLIYDAAHAFGTMLRGQGLLSFGDAATISFHATKLFHTIEGGAIAFRRKEDLERARQIINFGQVAAGDVPVVGMNAKLNELQAAMGLCVLDEIESVYAGRRRVCETYDVHLPNSIQRPTWHADATKNGAYYPVLLSSEARVLDVMEAMRHDDIYPRRYFHPTLNTLATMDRRPSMPAAEDAARRVLCLPLWPGLEEGAIRRVAAYLEARP